MNIGALALDLFFGCLSGMICCSLGTEVDQDYEDSIDFNDPPPLPPQRFATADVENVSKPQLSKPQVHT